MSGILRISDAAALALHTAVYLAARPRRVSVREVAEVLGASESHLAKVLQRLTRAGLTVSARGPAGGYALASPAVEVTLLEVYEAIEGPFQPQGCLLARPVCDGKRRILGGLLLRLNHEFREYMCGTSLADVAGVYGECEGCHGQEHR